MQVSQLTPIDSRKSFYNKCEIITEGDIIKLKSYSTIVATYNKATNKMTVNGWYSSTTTRHINSFLSYFGFATCSKKQLENYNN